MDITRFIFRGHLLPPFVTPFTSLRLYLKMFAPEKYSDIVNLRADLAQPLI